MIRMELVKPIGIEALQSIERGRFILTNEEKSAYIADALLDKIYTYFRSSS